MAEATAADSEGTEITPTEALPPLSPSEFRAFNRIAEHMDLYHNHFRHTWNQLYTVASEGRRPAGVSLRAYINTGLEFCTHLEMHHSIEERHVFPQFAERMPTFRKELELLTQHKQIHAGLDQFQHYLKECTNGEQDLRMDELKRLMDGFGGVLWQHLDDEVKQLGAENMRKYWTLEEMKRIPFG
ncbi:MAG: hypothetical protein M1833_000933 [Piccolia ochrophora]|nr:MAG: hypothetical protein M1833_000933 [Piccolia ochrophora]